MKKFEHYLESLVGGLKLSRRESLLSPYRNSLLPKLSLWETAIRYNKNLEYQEIIKKSDTVDLSPIGLELLIEKIKKEIIGVAEDNIKVLEKLKKRSEKASKIESSSVDFNTLQIEYNTLLPEIEKLIKENVSRISSDSTVTAIKHSFSGPLNPKGLFSINIALETNLPKLDINKTDTKSALKEKINTKIMSKIGFNAAFGTIGKEIARQLNSKNIISHKIRFREDPGVKIEAITPFISDKSVLALSKVTYSLNLFFSLGTKK